MRGWGKLIITEFKLYLREPTAAFFTLAFPLMMLFLFGSIYGNKPTPLFGGYGTVDVSVPAYTAMIIGSVSLLGIPVVIATFREKGILRRFRATPLRPQAILVSRIVVDFGMSLLGMALLVIAGKAVYNLRFEGNIFYVALAFALSALSFFSAGFLIASLAPTTRVAQTVGMVLFYPMLFLSGAAIPLEILPENIRRISNLLPLTYVVKLLKGMWFGESWGKHLVETAILAGILIVSTAISSRVFRWE
ncbi:MAG: ABC transporter permease [Chloroflexi bacterium]|nr:MAG: ABC transporter permease [Chloroflexota bacterium]HDN79566.1 ABC transporter permease [Chloroflexota bacterium]